MWQACVGEYFALIMRKLFVKNKIIRIFAVCMKDLSIRCCGDALAPDEAEVQRVMTQHGLSFAEQAGEWLRLARQWPEPSWIERCMAAAERMTALVERERAVEAVLGTDVDLAMAVDGRRRPRSAWAERQFEWLGERRGVPVEVVRDGIERLAARGFLSREAEQQAALRRGLGLALNATERSSRAPWVRWTGEGDALNYLVDSLWQMELIYCSGGQRYKWKTLCGVFLRSDGSCFEPSIKSNRCGNREKRKAVDEAMLDGLRFCCRR